MSVFIGISAVLTASAGLALVLANSGPPAGPTAPSALPDNTGRQTLVLGQPAASTGRPRPGTPTPTPLTSSSASATATAPTPTPTASSPAKQTPTTPSNATATTQPTAAATVATTTTYLAVSPTTALAGGAVVQNCSACTGGEKVGYVGNGGTVTFNDVNATTNGVYPVQIEYCDGSSGSTGRSATVTVDGVAVQTIVFTPTGSFSTPSTVTVRLSLKAGSNSVEFSDPSAYTPDFNSIVVTL